MTAVVVTRGPTPYLATTLAAVVAQSRPASQILVVDVAGGPADASDRVAELVAAAHDGGTPVRRLHVPQARTFGDAVRRALADGAPPDRASATSTRGATGWIWLLHDDSAPEPGALAELVRVVEGAPSVAVAGAKQRTWTEPARLLEVGLRTSRSGRRMTWIEDAEVDQGQHDGREDVLGVGIAGALVRRDVWDALGGTDPALGQFGDGFDLSRRARLAGHRVVVVPTAVVRHAQASYHGLRGTPVVRVSAAGTGVEWVEVDADADGVPDAADARRSFAARRRSLIHQRVVAAPLPLVPVVVVLAFVAAVVRALGRVVSKEPGLAVRELVAPFAALTRVHAIVRSRARLRATRQLPRRALRPLQATGREVAAQWRDRRLARAESRKVGTAVSELELGELATLAARRRSALGGLLALLAAVTAVALGPLITRVLGGAHLVGPALVPSAAHLGELWHAATSGWVSGGFGTPGPADPLLVALLPGTALLGGASATAVGVVVLGAVLLAGLGAWFAAGAATRSIGLRLWAAITWSAAPALLLGVGDGRLGAIVVHLALPWFALGLARAVGVQRVDTVISGLVTARRGDETDDDLDDGLASAQTAHDEAQQTKPGQASTGDAGTEPAGIEPADELARELRDLAAPVLDDARAAPSTDDRLDAAGPSGSLAAAAGAALAFALVVAGAPSLLVPGVVVLLVIAACVPRARARVLFVPAPALVLVGPVLAEVVTRGRAGLRLLVADPGPALDATPADAWHQALGVPVTGGGLVPTGLPGGVQAVGAVALGAVVVALAVLALLRGAPAARAVRVAWLVAVVGAVTAATSGLLAVGAVDGSTVHGWPGSGLSLASAGLVAAGLIGADGLAARLAQASFGWRQPTAVLVAVVAGVVPVATLGAWSWQARTGAAVGLETIDRRIVPAVGQQAQSAPGSSRVLALAADVDDVLGWQLLRGDGPQLVDQAAAVTTRTLRGPLTAPRLAAPDDATTEIQNVVARLGAGTSGDVSPDLAALAVADVLVPPSVGPAADAARSRLVSRLDATAGLGRITENSSGTIWRVQPAPAAGTTPAPIVVGWARLVAGTTGPVAVAADGRSVRTTIPAGPADRLLVLAETADPAWHATLDGHPLRTVAGGWRQTFEVGADGGRLVVELRDSQRLPWLVLQGTVMVLTVLLAVPIRRRRAGRR